MKALRFVFVFLIATTGVVYLPIFINTVVHPDNTWLVFLSGYIGAIIGGLISGLFTYLGVYAAMNVQKREKFIEDFPSKIKSIDDMLDFIGSTINDHRLGLFLEGQGQYVIDNAGLLVIESLLMK